MQADRQITNILITKFCTLPGTKLQLATTVMVARARIAAEYGSLNRIHQVAPYVLPPWFLGWKWGQTTSQSVQPFLLGSLSWSTQTDKPHSGPD